MTTKANNVATLHEKRLQLQKELDVAKTQEERNKLGQFATPPALANAIVKSTKVYYSPGSHIRFFDPAFGTGAFYTAIIQVYTNDKIESAMGVEIDPHYGKPAQRYWQTTCLELALADFTQLVPPSDEHKKPNLIICNPPYTRHHHLSPQYKREIGKQAKTITGIKLTGLSGLYCYFLFIAHSWLAAGGIGCWLIPGEFLDVNYGKEVKAYLLNRVRLLRIHRFDPVDTQFEDALVSSVVVWFYNQAPNPDNKVEFTFGDNLDHPKGKKVFLNKHLDNQAKWSQLFRKNEVEHNVHSLKKSGLKVSDLFYIKRGIATGANNFFILTLNQIRQNELPIDCFVPILPSPRHLKQDQIIADKDGIPFLEKTLFLLNCNLPESEAQAKYPNLWVYLEKGKKQKIHERYLCRHRSPWYAQEFRPPSPVLCTYMGRGKTPFRFILNQSKAIASNVYLMLYPKKDVAQQIGVRPELLTQVWRALKNLEPRTLMSEGRVYGGGLFKIEPNELGNVLLTGIEEILPSIQSDSATQLTLF